MEMFITDGELLSSLQVGFVFLNKKRYQIEKVRLFQKRKGGRIVCRNGKSKLEVNFSGSPCSIDFLKKNIA